MQIEKVENFVANLHDKTEYIIQIRNFKQTSNHRLVLKKFPRVIKFTQKAWLKLCIDTNTDLRGKKTDFEKDFFKLVNNSDFRNNIKNVRKHRDIKLIPTEKRRSYLGS